RLGFVWTLSADELAVAYRCDLAVRASGVATSHGKVRKVAAVTVNFAVDGDEEVSQTISDESSLSLVVGEGDAKTTYGLSHVEIARLALLQKPAFVGGTEGGAMRVRARVIVGNVDITKPEDSAPDEAQVQVQDEEEGEAEEE